jgi:hypothetical protein
VLGAPSSPARTSTAIGAPSTTQTARNAPPMKLSSSIRRDAASKRSGSSWPARARIGSAALSATAGTMISTSITRNEVA